MGDATAELARYLERTLLDEMSKVVHDESCAKYLSDRKLTDCDCDASAEWKETLVAIYHSVERLSELKHPDALMIMLELATPYRRGSHFPA